MTNEQAREILQQIRTQKCVSECDYSCKLYESETICFEEKALDIAIKALEEQRNLTNEELYQSFIKLEAENERLHDALESQRWIPVSSGKLPDEQTHVIVTIGNERFTSVQLCLYTSTSIFWKEYVKAWMPLPQAYKAESEDEE